MNRYCIRRYILYVLKYVYETYIYALLPDIVFVGKPVLTVHSLSHQETPLSRAFLPAMAYQSWDDSLEN